MKRSVSQTTGLKTLNTRLLDIILLILAVLGWLGVFAVALVGALIGVGV